MHNRVVKALVRKACDRFLYTLIILIPISAAQAVDANVSLSQADGTVLTLPAPAQRIITLAPNLAELVFAAGAGDKLHAVVEYSNFPSEVQQLPRVGDAFRIDLERIIEFTPDLVIAWKSGNPQNALYKLEQLGVNVWQVEIARPEEIAATVEAISIAAGTQAEGLPVARQLQNRLAQLKREYADKSVVEYFYQIAARPLYTINGQHIISRSLEICGGRNAFSGLSALAPQISRESVVLANPQAMIAPKSPDDPSALASWQEWPQLTAVQNNSMVYLPADEISQATPRLLDSIDLACKLLDQVRKTDNQMDQQ